jgi:hypothetical protein
VIRVVLPAHLRTLVHTEREVEVEIVGQPTQRSSSTPWRPDIRPCTGPFETR